MKDFKKGLIYAGVLAFCIGFGAYIYCNSIKKKIPDKLYIYKQDKAVFSMDIPVFFKQKMTYKKCKSVFSKILIPLLVLFTNGSNPSLS